MENKVPSLSDISTNSNSDESFHDEDINKKYKTSDEADIFKFIESKSVSSEVDCNDLKTRNLVLDLRNLTEINDFQNDEEKYEKLSEVIEEPEDLPEVTIINDHEIIPIQSREIYDKNEALQERISSLNNVILSLKNELKREVSLWRKERDEYQILKEKSDLIALEEATAAARAAAEAYAAESPLSDDLDGFQYNCCNFTAGEILDVNPEQTLSELTILEYEKKLAKYQDALAFAHAEKRYNMRRQLAANTYRQKLMEVERLCDEELEKIKENANSLQPLKKIVSQWYNDGDLCCGDAADQSANSQNIDNVYKSFSPYYLQQIYPTSTLGDNKKMVNKIDAEVNMAPEIFVAKFNVEGNDFLSSGIQSGNKWSENDFNRRYVTGGGNISSSINWDDSNYMLSTSLGNP